MSLCLVAVWPLKVRALDALQLLSQCNHTLKSAGHSTPMDDRLAVSRLSRIISAVERQIEDVSKHLEGNRSRGSGDSTQITLRSCLEQLDVRIIELNDARNQVLRNQRNAPLDNERLATLLARAVLHLRQHESWTQLAIPGDINPHPEVTTAKATGFDGTAHTIELVIVDNQVCITGQDARDACWRVTRAGVEFVFETLSGDHSFYARLH